MARLSLRLRSLPATWVSLDLQLLLRDGPPRKGGLALRALSRRNFLERIGHAGGYSAAFLALQGLGLMPARALAPQPIAAASGSGRGVKVVILGAGIAGMVTAYELRALGYECTVLEARSRPGGRNYTVRSDDTVTLTDGSTQRCTWSPGHYQNFGPARLPSVHRTMLAYCRALGVPLEVEINCSRSSHLQDDDANGGKPVVQRQLLNDSRGYVSELLAKCVATGNLNADLSADDRTRMLDFLRTYGPLDTTGRYLGSERAGYAKEDGAGNDVGIFSKPLDLETLLHPTFWNGMLFDEQFDMQPTMFQPVGGMDRIAYAFATSLGSVIHFDSPVTELRKTAHGVRVAYTGKGSAHTLEADLCVSCLPLNQLAKFPADLSPAVRTVITSCTYADAYKVAWESRRFWEQDDNIYGGLEFCGDTCGTVWLPSANLFSERGVLVSGYGFSSPEDFDRMSLDQKFATSRRSIEKLHPGRGHELQNPMYVGWHRMPWNEGSWIDTYDPEPAPARDTTANAVNSKSPRRRASQEATTSPGYHAMLEPDGPIYFATDGLSHVNAWQEGAALSARRAVNLIAQRTRSSNA